MKWYSIKKYRPTSDLIIVHAIRISNKDSIIFAAFYHADESEEFKFQSRFWQNLEEVGEFKITHFCIPDPIELTEFDDLEE